MGESKEPGVRVVGILGCLEAQIGELCGNFCGALRRLCFDDERVLAPCCDGDSRTSAELTSILQPCGILLFCAREKSHSKSIERDGRAHMVCSLCCYTRVSGNFWIASPGGRDAVLAESRCASGTFRKLKMDARFWVC
jgi:hypothetical protein